MAITLSDGTLSITLPDDLLWADQHNWSPIEQSVETSITGASIIDIATRVNGRPVTLEGGERYAWMAYSVVEQIKVWAGVAGKTLTLTIRGTAFDVMFRHHEQPAIEFTPIIDYAAPDSQDFFYGRLKFMEI